MANEGRNFVELFYKDLPSIFTDEGIQINISKFGRYPLTPSADFLSFFSYSK